MINLASYLVWMQWSEEDEAFLAIMPDLPGCSAFGDTPEEAAHEIYEAAIAWTLAKESNAEQIPKPKRQITDIE